MVSFAVELFANLFDASLSVIFILQFCKCKYREHKVTSTITILICFFISTAYLFISSFSILQSILIFIILLLFSLNLKTSTILPKLLSPIIFELALISVSTLCLVAYSYLFNYQFNNLVSEVSEIRYLYMLSCKIILTVALMIIIKIFSIKSSFRAIDFILYLFSPSMTVIVLYTFIQIAISYDISRYFSIVMFSVLGLVAINIFSLLLFVEASKNLQAKYELEIFKQQEALEHKKYSELKNIYEQITTQRHDFKKQLLGLNRLVASGDLSALSKFLSETEVFLNEPIDYIHTNNRMLDYIINSKITMNSDLKFIVTGEMQSLTILTETDTASLFGNMIDNAIEACKNIAPAPIEIDFFVKNNYQNILCKNPIRQSVLNNNPSLRTTKLDKSIHGYGIKSMRNIVEIANGFIEFYEENNMFCVHIALPIEKNLER